MKAFNPTASKKTISWFFIFLIMFYSVGCRYFKAKQVDMTSVETIQEIGQLHKSFFVHHRGDVHSLSEIKVDSVYISGFLTNASRFYYQDGRTNYRIKNDEKNIVNEVHIYVNQGYALNALGQTQIPLSAIDKVIITDLNGGKTAASFIFGGLGIILGVIVIITVIVALTKSSCPYVYSNDGEGFVFEGEIYGGAIASNLQREDYLPLKALKSDNDFYKIRISNELKERQYTDLAELVVIEHNDNQKVLLDKKGLVQIVSEPRRPLSAFNSSGEDILGSIEKKDSVLFFFNDINYSKNDVLMRFKIPENVDKAKLVINGQNTLWFDYQFGEFLSKFGVMYESFMNKQSELPQEEREQMAIDNDFPLSILIKKGDKWETIERLNTIGPLASRDFVIPIDLSNSDEDYIEIKLETGFMFWQVDFAGLDFTSDEETKVITLKPISAQGTGSVDWSKQLNDIDKDYMAQEQTGDIAEIVYRSVKSRDQKAYSYFLHTSGYYELVRDFDGIPKFAELNQFKTNGYFSDFSRANYLKLIDKQELLAKSN